MLDTYARKGVQPLFERLADLCIVCRLTPNSLTLLSLGVGVFAGPITYFGRPVAALVFLWLSGLLDVLDGTVARRTGKTSAVGTVMDVTFDRMVELSVILGVAFRDPEIAMQLLVLTSCIVLSLTVFLSVGAAARNSGAKSFFYQAGIAERSEGFLMLSLMIALPRHAGPITLLFAALVFLTACQRFMEARRILQGPAS